ncbi:MAG: DUF1800 domain-containing protein [Tepidisphaeraceae bacterium]
MIRTNHPLLQPFTPTEGDRFDAIKAAHLLNRCGFGGTQEEIAEVLRAGPSEAVERLLDFPDAGADEQSQTDVPDFSGIEGYPKTFAERRKLFEGLSPQERQDLQQKLNAANREAVFALVRWWLGRMTSGPYPLQEKLTLMWHGHFTTSASDERSAWLMWQQHETLRRYAGGNFRQFVHAISRDPAMIDYLNNQQNRKGHPNENYARELMELFTLGIGNYSENDIKEAARAFTGWGNDGDDFIFRRNFHDDGEKSFFGKRGNFDGHDIIDIILGGEVSSRYIASKLYGWFAHDVNDESLAGALGTALKQSNYELRPLLRTILTSRGFYSEVAMFTQIKSPIQLLIGMVRQMGVRMPAPGDTRNFFQASGQMPLNPPNVKGWPGGRTWINTSTLFVRYNAGVRLAGTIEKNALVPPGARAPSDVVNHWLTRLIQRPIAEDKRQLLVEAATPVNRDTARKVVELIVSMPEYQLC